jgi:hypothetical protein
VLRVISSSPGELDLVFQTMLANAIRICDANFGALFRFEDGVAAAAAMLGVPPAFAEFWQRGPYRPGREQRSVASCRLCKRFTLPMSQWTRPTLRVNRSL